MNIVVCVKLVPDPTAPSSLNTSHYLVRTGKLLLDEADTYGIEVGLRLVDESGGGEVTVISMGSAHDVAGLRNALAMGAARAVIVSDDSLRGSDALGTAKVLASVIRRINPDLVICATESSDGYTGTMPVQLAELLALPSITFAKSVTLGDTVLKVERQTELGYDEVTSPLPALITVTAGIVEPRYASFKGIMAAKSKPIEVLSLADLAMTDEVGEVGARQRIIDVAAAETISAGEKYVDEGDGAARIIAFLESIKTI